MPLPLTESAIREKLIESLSGSKDGESAVFIRELFIQDFARRADLVVANGHLAAFEIKSARDTLDRLDGQLSAYADHFEKVTVVVAAKHLAAVLSRVPKRVGVWETSDGGELTKHRDAREQRVTKTKLLTFLPVDELRALVRSCGKTWAGDRADLLCAANKLRYEAIRTYVLAFMQRRGARLAEKASKRILPMRYGTPEEQQRLTQERLDRYLQNVSANTSRAIPRRVA